VWSENESVRPIEKAVFGDVTEAEMLAWLGNVLEDHMHAPVSSVLFRRGRVAAVFGLELLDGRQVAVKVHRNASNLDQLAAVTACQTALAATGYPCPRPLVHPFVASERSVVVESLADAGSAADGHLPAVRRALAESLAGHIRALKRVTPATARRLEAPAWARYEGGPWPAAHDPMFDFSQQYPEYEWLERLASASSRLLPPAAPEVIGHSDWSCGNVSFRDAEIVATFDWDSLIAHREPVLVGLSAGSFPDGGIGGPSAPTPDEVAAFLGDYSDAAEVAFTSQERDHATAASTWVLCYNARCEVSAEKELGIRRGPGSALDVLLAHGGDAYLRPSG